MTVHEFVKKEIKLLEQFEKHWQEKAEHSEDYPLKLPPGEWDEQFTFYSSKFV